MVLVAKLQVVAQKKDFLRFGQFGGRFKDATMVTELPDDSTFPMDVPPLLDPDTAPSDLTPLKRDRNSSAPASVRIASCPMMCRRPDSFICAKTGEPHTISVCEFCGDHFDPLEPFCHVRRGHRHAGSTSTASTSAASTPLSPPTLNTQLTSSEEDNMVPIQY